MAFVRLSAVQFYGLYIVFGQICYSEVNINFRARGVGVRALFVHRVSL